MGVALLLAFFAPLLTATSLEDNGDVGELFLPNQVMTARAFQDGAIPLWNPYQFGGTPVHAALQASILYPPAWPGRFIGEPQVWGIVWLNALRLFHIALLGWGLYGFARSEWGLDPIPSLFPAVALCGSGYMACHVVHANQIATLAWAPWIMLHARRLAYGGGVRSMLGLSATWSCSLLAGHPQNLLYITVLLAIITPAWCWMGSVAHRRTSINDATSPTHYSLLTTLYLFGLSGLIALALTAAQWLPSLRASKLAWTSAESGDYASLFALPPIGLLGYLWPGYFGQDVGVRYPDYMEWAFHEFGIYLGLSTIPLAVLGIVCNGSWAVVRKPASTLIPSAFGDEAVDAPASTPHAAPRITRPETFALIAAAVLALLVALGDATPVFGWLGTVFPPLLRFRAHVRGMVVTHIALALLAGAGLQVLLAKLDAKKAAIVGGAVLAILVGDLAWASRGALFRYPSPHGVTWREHPLAETIERDRADAKIPEPARVAWMIREDLYFLRGPSANAARAGQLTPNENLFWNVEITHGYGESLQPTLRWRDLLFTYNRSFFRADPDLALLRLIGASHAITDIAAPIALGEEQRVLGRPNQPGFARLFFLKDAPWPRVMSVDETLLTNIDDDLTLYDALTTLDGLHRWTKNGPAQFMVTEDIPWRDIARRFRQPSPEPIGMAGSIVVEPAHAWNRQRFSVKDRPVSGVFHLVGAYPGWTLRKTTGEEIDTKIEATSAVASRAMTKLEPGDYEFVFVPNEWRLGLLITGWMLGLCAMLFVHDRKAHRERKESGLR